MIYSQSCFQIYTQNHDCFLLLLWYIPPGVINTFGYHDIFERLGRGSRSWMEEFFRARQRHWLVAWLPTRREKHRTRIRGRGHIPVNVKTLMSDPNFRWNMYASGKFDAFCIGPIIMRGPHFRPQCHRLHFDCRRTTYAIDQVTISTTAK